MSYTCGLHAHSNGGHISLRVERRLLFLDRFLHSSWESNEPFLGSASVIPRPVICQVSIAGKHSLHQNYSMEIMLCWKRLFSARAFVCWITMIGIVDYFCVIVELKENRTWKCGFSRDLSYGRAMIVWFLPLFYHDKWIILWLGLFPLYLNECFLLNFLL